MIHEREVREKIAALLARQISLSAFERWLGSESWNMFNDSQDAVPVVASVNMLVHELHDAIISDEQFHGELASLLNNVVVHVNVVDNFAFAPFRIAARSNSKPVIEDSAPKQNFLHGSVTSSMTGFELLR